MALGKPIRTDTKAWYKHFWPWLVLFFPTVAVVAGITTVIIAVKTDDGLVENEYYKKGLLINFSKELDQNARDMGLSGYARFDSSAKELYLLIDETQSGATLSDLVVTLKHATRADMDQSITIERLSEKEFKGELDILSPGKWNVVVESAEEWRLIGTVVYPDRFDTKLLPREE